MSSSSSDQHQGSLLANMQERVIQTDEGTVVLSDTSNANMSTQNNTGTAHSAEIHCNVTIQCRDSFTSKPHNGNSIFLKVQERQSTDQITFLFLCV